MILASKQMFKHVEHGRTFAEHENCFTERSILPLRSAIFFAEFVQFKLVIIQIRKKLKSYRNGSTSVR